VVVQAFFQARLAPLLSACYAWAQLFGKHGVVGRARSSEFAVLNKKNAQGHAGDSQDKKNYCYNDGFHGACLHLAFMRRIFNDWKIPFLKIDSFNGTSTLLVRAFPPFS